MTREEIYAKYDSTFERPSRERLLDAHSTRKCVRCNERFPYTSTARIYCSIKCRTLAAKARDKNYKPPESHHDDSVPVHHLAFMPGRHLALDMELREYSLVDDDSGWMEQDPDVVKAFRALPKKRYGPPPTS